MSALLKRLFDNETLRVDKHASMTPSRFMGALMGTSPVEILQMCHENGIKKFDGTPKSITAISQSKLFRCVTRLLCEHETLRYEMGGKGKHVIVGATEVTEEVDALIATFIQEAKAHQSENKAPRKRKVHPQLHSCSALV